MEYIVGGYYQVVHHYAACRAHPVGSIFEVDSLDSDGDAYSSEGMLFTKNDLYTEKVVPAKPHDSQRKSVWVALVGSHLASGGGVDIEGAMLFADQNYKKVCDRMGEIQ